VLYRVIHLEALYGVWLALMRSDRDFRFVVEGPGA
jgi:hypothetical protein